jgi:hypothetical protein
MRTMTDRFFISDGGEMRGPYAKDQLRSMWGAGQITAAAMACAEGSQEWKGIQELQLMAGATPPPIPAEAAKIVETKGSGAGAVAIGSVLCAVGVVLACIPNLAGFGVLLLLAGFFTAVVGRLMS